LVAQTRNSPALAEIYSYDERNRRIGAAVDGTVTNFLYAGEAIYGEYAAGWGAPQVLYTHGPGIDHPLLRKTPSETRFYHQDALGSVTALSDETGASYANGFYGAWGDSFGLGSPPLPRYSYTGREPDGAERLLFYRNRWYWPGFRRFVSKDPIGLAGGINPYAYVNNNPTNLTDPTGLLPFSPLLADSLEATSYAGGVATDWYETFAPGDVLAQAPPRQLQLEIPRGNYTPTPSIQNIFSFSQSMRLQEQIQRYDPNFRYAAIRDPAIGFTRQDVSYLESVLAVRQAAFNARVNEFAQAQGFGIRNETVAVLRAFNPQTGTTTDLVASSQGQLSDAILRMLRPGELPVRGFSSHAETNAIAFARSQGMVPLVTGATNNICPSCQGSLLYQNVLPSTPLNPRGPLYDVFGPNWGR
jgi:RHS repeat-associated protein